MFFLFRRRYLFRTYKTTGRESFLWAASCKTLRYGHCVFYIMFFWICRQLWEHAGELKYCIRTQYIALFSFLFLLCVVRIVRLFILFHPLSSISLSSAAPEGCRVRRTKSGASVSAPTEIMIVGISTCDVCHSYVCMCILKMEGE